MSIMNENVLKLRAQLICKLEDSQDGFRSADYLRALMVTTPFLAECDESEKSEFVTLATINHWSEYAGLVDDLKGVNNYAEAVTKFTNGCKNESKSWRSSLSSESLAAKLSRQLSSVAEDTSNPAPGTGKTEHTGSKQLTSGDRQKACDLSELDISGVCADYGVPAPCLAANSSAVSQTSSGATGVKYSAPRHSTSLSSRPPAFSLKRQRSAIPSTAVSSSSSSSFSSSLTGRKETNKTGDSGLNNDWLPSNAGSYHDNDQSTSQNRRGNREQWLSWKQRRGGE